MIQKLLETKFNILYISHPSLHIVDLAGVRSDPPRVEWHRFFVFRPMGPPDPKIFFRHIFGHKKLEKVTKFHGCNLSSFVMTVIFRQWGQI